MTRAEAIRALAAKGLTPRGLSCAEAAAYVGLSTRSFQREVAAGRAPAPLALGCRRRLWPQAVLDAWLSGPRASEGSSADPIMAAIHAHKRT